MKNYKQFITFIVFFTAGFYWINGIISIPVLSSGLISTIIFLLFLLWDKYLWKVKRFPIPLIGKLMGFYNYPNLSGEWEAIYRSSYKPGYGEENKKEGKGSIKIKQTYTSIFINGNFGTSKFESFVSKLKQKENGNWILIYGYRNRPIDEKLLNSKDGGMHEGFCCLEVCETEKLEGYYTNDENRKTRGKIILTKKNLPPSKAVLSNPPLAV